MNNTATNTATCPIREARYGQELPCILHRERRHRARVLLSRDRYQAGREPDGILLREAFREP